MKLLLVRHAKAEDHDHERWPDDSLRPLTARGIERFRESAKGLAKLVTPDVVVTSPFVRARQTASILHETAGWPEPRESQAVPDGAVGPLVVNHGMQSDATLAIVGHEPTLSHFVSQIVSGSGGAAVRMRPGAAALIEVYRDALPELSGELVWLLQPKVSGRIG